MCESDMFSSCLKYPLTNDRHERVEVANVDTFLCHIDEVLNHSDSILLLQVLNQ